MIYWRVDSSISIVLALVGFVCVPILLILYNKNILFQGEILSERVAVWAYYFLVIGIVKQIFEYLFESRNKKSLNAKINAKKYKKITSHTIDLRNH